MTSVEATYYTDPADPWSWAMEPTMRRLRWELGDQLALRHVMGGLARQFEDPAPIVSQWLSAGAAGGMPVDARLWLESPPASSYPACLAMQAAGEQGDPAPYLRRLREGFACRRRKLDTGEALVEEARAAGLDVARFSIDLASNAIAELFAADLERAGAVDEAHRDPVRKRVRLPSVEYRGPGGEVEGVYGFAPYEDHRATAERAGAQFGDAPSPSVEEALRNFGSMSTAEIAAVCGLPGPRAPAELWRAAQEWRVKAEPFLGGELWSPA